MIQTLAIDPGASTGWAVFHGRALAGVGVWQRGAPRVAADELNVIIECPMIYPRSPVPPNDIVRLALRVGRLAERVLRDHAPKHVDLFMVLPRDWKGQVPKKTHNARVLAALPASDLAVARARLADVPESQWNDAVDAIGLGAWFVAHPCDASLFRVPNV